MSSITTLTLNEQEISPMDRDLKTLRQIGIIIFPELCLFVSEVLLACSASFSWKSRPRPFTAWLYASVRHLYW